MSAAIDIRKARVNDLGGILALVRELAEYERAPQEVTATLEVYEEAFTNGVFDALVAEQDGQILGMALYYLTFSTWKGPMMYLEDFVVTEQQRGAGIGLRLFDRFLEESRNAGAILCKWQVLAWNEPAIRFYERLPTVFDDEWINVKYFL